MMHKERSDVAKLHNGDLTQKKKPKSLQSSKNKNSQDCWKFYR